MAQLCVRGFKVGGDCLLHAAACMEGSLRFNRAILRIKLRQLPQLEHFILYLSPALCMLCDTGALNNGCTSRLQTPSWPYRAKALHSKDKPWSIRLSFRAAVYLQSPMWPLFWLPCCVVVVRGNKLVQQEKATLDSTCRARSKQPLPLSHAARQDAFYFH